MGERELTADEILLLVRARGFRPTRIQLREGVFAGKVFVEQLPRGRWETHRAIRGYAWPDEWDVYEDFGHADHPDQPRVAWPEEWEARPVVVSVAGILAAPQPPPPGDYTARDEYEAAVRCWSEP